MAKIGRVREAFDDCLHRIQCAIWASVLGEALLRVDQKVRPTSSTDVLASRVRKLERVPFRQSRRPMGELARIALDGSKECSEGADAGPIDGVVFG